MPISPLLAMLSYILAFVTLPAVAISVLLGGRWLAWANVALWAVGVLLIAVNVWTDPYCCNGYDIAGFAGILALLVLAGLWSWLVHSLVKRLVWLRSQR